MCGILAVLPRSKAKSDEALLKLAQKQSKLMSHRGPDESDSWVDPVSGTILCHERLSIVDLERGKQPIKGRTQAHVIHNGEIYNHMILREELKHREGFIGHSDSEIIVRLYEEQGIDSITKLDGMYTFVISDGDKFLVGRDPIGVKPLYFGLDRDGHRWFASEVKALCDICLDIEEFPPGHYWTPETGLVAHFKPAWFQGAPALKGPERLKETLTAAVKKRLMSDVPVGVLLSGGLDSSLVSSLAAREMKKLGKTLKSFSVGMGKDAPDLMRAREVADFIGTEHHEVIFTLEEGIAALRDLIHKVESYDITTIRASTPMYLMSKYIRSQGVKVVLSGEGADEIFGGYLYFSHAPSAEEFHEECLSRIKRLHTADLQRADRATMGTGVEARVPFLDRKFLEASMELDPMLKMIIPGQRMEKFVLRQAFVDSSDPYLPSHILWRQKEQFSDGVGYGWIDGLKAYAESQVTDEQFAQAAQLFPFNTPTTKEAFFYRCIYSELFPHVAAEKLVRKWVPKWQDYNQDPSGRANSMHTQTYVQKDLARTDSPVKLKTSAKPKLSLMA